MDAPLIRVSFAILVGDEIRHEVAPAKALGILKEFLIRANGDFDIASADFIASLERMKWLNGQRCK